MEHKTTHIMSDGTIMDGESMSEKSESYQPLIWVLVFSLLMAVAVNFNQPEMKGIMLSFMGFFFLLLSLFKVFDLTGFADGFSTYDVFAGRWRAYGYLYPFLELGLGLAYLARLELFWVSLLTALLMALSGLGVYLSIRAKRKIKCVCLGNILNVPLSTVSLVENLGMGLMAFWTLISLLVN